MNIKYLMILLLFFVCFEIGLTGPALAKQSQMTTQVAVAENSDNGSGFQNQLGEKVLTLKEALNLTLKHNPILASFAEEIHVKDASALQAGLLPNPELGVGVENFAGQNALKDFDGAETTVVFSQLIELGGKRSNRHQVAKLEKDLAELEYQSKKLDVLAITAKAFIQVLIAQDQVFLNDELVKLAEKTHDAVVERVEAGKASQMESTRTEIELAAVRTEANKSHRELEAARRRLAAQWGADRAEFNQVIGNLAKILPLIPEEDIQDLLGQNPDLVRWKSELKRREATLDLALSQIIPDITLNFGLRNFREADSNAFLAGIEVPLPLFNRNQGGISEARANIQKAHQEQRSAEIMMKTALSDAWKRLSTAYVELTNLQHEILPRAQNAFEATKFGYIEGKFDFLQMLDAQRTLFTVKRQHLLAQGDYHLAYIDIERLIAAPLENHLASAIKENQ